MSRVLTAESVTEGHPDKVADFIADSILDAYLESDPASRVACEVLCKGRHVILAGEITASARVNLDAVTREAVRAIGYVDPEEAFNAGAVEIISLLSPQAREIAQAVRRQGAAPDELGAGDQGIMVGYASDESAELMPLPILLAHRLARRLAQDRKSGVVSWLRPDGKTQVSIEYEGLEPVQVTHVLISVQHQVGTTRERMETYLRGAVVPQCIGPDWYRDDLPIMVNPSGSFVEGGPSADCGLTGRKNIVDTYGPLVGHGGGSFSGKDPTKVDRSASYFCRWVARQLVRRGLARRAEVQVAYAIGRSEPLAVSVKTFATGEARAATEFARGFDFRPAAIIERLGLRRPIYRLTTNYGHFGRGGLPWEEDE